MSAYKHELCLLIELAKTFLEKQDDKQFYFYCGKVSQLCKFMIQEQKDRNIRSMTILVEVSKALDPFGAMTPIVFTFNKALDMIRTI